MGIAGMGCATIFFWLQLPNVSKSYRTALIITGLVTTIATYHYVRIFNSWGEAFNVSNVEGGDYTVELSGAPFNDAYRYVDWLLTVPLLLIELILVMKLPKADTVKLSWSLGVASAVMVALGYPGEIQDNLSVRWFWWAMAMIRIQGSATCWPVCNFQSSARRLYRGGACPWQGSGENSWPTNLLSGTGQSTSFRNCTCDRSLSSAAHF